MAGPESGSKPDDTGCIPESILEMLILKKRSAHANKCMTNYPACKKSTVQKRYIAPAAEVV